MFGCLLRTSLYHLVSRLRFEIYHIFYRELLESQLEVLRMKGQVPATRDIIHCISLRDYFQQKISDWGIGVGQVIYTDTITHIDCETASSLKEYISL